MTSNADCGSKASRAEISRKLFSPDARVISALRPERTPVLVITTVDRRLFHVEHRTHKRGGSSATGVECEPLRSVDQLVCANCFRYESSCFPEF